MMMRLTLIFCLLFLQFFTFAQTSSNRRAQKNFDEARQKAQLGNYNAAIQLLREAKELDSNFQAAYFELGNIYKKLNQYSNAKDHFHQGLKVAKLQNANFYFSIGQTDLLAGDYEAAQTHLNLFISEAQNINPQYLSQAQKYLADCQFAINALKNPVPYQPKNLGPNINSVYKDYFPALTADGNTIIFTRNVDGNEDFYTATRLSGNWTMAKPLSKNINTSQYNEGAQSISPDGRYLFFTGCNRPDGFGRCDIYLCVRQGENWSKPINLGKTINTSDWESQPSISADGKTLYFLSNRPGGFGGYDIWKSTIDEHGQWTTPINLGPQVNTPYDEATPFIHADGKTLYFASEGWPGMGGKDLYYCTLQDDGTFSKAINLGYPINTYRDEFGLIVSTDGKSGLLSANIDGGFGDVDIYQFDIPEKIQANHTYFVKGKVKDKDTNLPLEGNITIVKLSNQQAVYNEISDTNGEFLAVMPSNDKYAFNVLAEGYMIYSQHFDLQKGNGKSANELDILMEKIGANKKVKLNNIFFDTNKFDLLPASIVELNLLIKFLQTNPRLFIEIQGHTDNIGSNKDNQILSENRAKAVYNYLVQHQIPSKQLKYRGYGESQPAANNDTPEGRQLNRRTEFIVTQY
jgi:outer membrane protein OmpA-like peptidoglycan-associated protein/tetratricopeptide (TPR) repeat protein